MHSDEFEFSDIFFDHNLEKLKMPDMCNYISLYIPSMRKSFIRRYSRRLRIASKRLKPTKISTQRRVHPKMMPTSRLVLGVSSLTTGSSSLTVCSDMTVVVLLEVVVVLMVVVVVVSLRLCRSCT